MNPRASHGDGAFRREDLGALGAGTVIEAGVLIFHPGRVRIGANVYIGHQAMLKGYHHNELVIGDGSWIGQGAFLHSAGGIRIGAKVGIGPHVRIITSEHEDAGRAVAVIDSPLRFAPVAIEDGCDIGVGAIVLPGVTIGRGAIIGAGAVVTHDIPAWSVAAGVPARVIRERP